MKRKILHLLPTLCCLALSLCKVLPSSSLQEVNAATGTAVDLRIGTVEAQVPTGISFGVTWTNHIDVPATPNVSDIAVTNGVSGQASIPASEAGKALAPAAATGFLFVYHNMPNITLAGFQGSSDNTATLSIKGDLDTNDDLQKIFFTNDASAISETKRVDDKVSPVDLFGANSPRCGGSSITDGMDRDGSLNGEFAFGGGNTSTGGCTMQYLTNLKVNLSGSEAQTDSLTYTLATDTISVSF